jgi:hypothetical protein
MSELEWAAPAKTWCMVKAKVIRITDTVRQKKKRKERKKKACARTTNANVWGVGVS